MRGFLDRLYRAAGALAAFFMVATLVMVVLGIAARLFAINIPGTDAYAGYCMAAAGFLALAFTLKAGEHIRVTLVLEHSGGVVRRSLERWSLAAGTVLAALFAFYSIRLAYQSWDFHDISTGNDATPLWIPQTSMALGTLVLLIAMVDELVLELRGARTKAAPAEALRHE